MRPLCAVRPPVGLLACAVWFLSIGSAAGQTGAPASAATSGCVRCHAELDGASREPVTLFREDVHQERGFSCIDCHGGNPNTDDPIEAKDERAGFRGKPAGTAIIEVCARCHSDADLMRRFSPRQRIDQASEYATSVHGRRLAAGDTKVATCVSCHGAHGIRLVSDARARVYPTNVANLCGTCHSSAEYLKDYRLSGGPYPVTQQSEYERSVHHAAMVQRNDLSAPTCNDCHGNHGAAPPGVGAVANVCGTCHAVFANRFDMSTHRQIFDRGCVECHSNHEIVPSSDDMVGTTPSAMCVTCHSEGDNGFAAAAEMRSGIDQLRTLINDASALTGRIHNAGMEVSDQEMALSEAQNRLTLARTELHSSDPARVAAVLKEGTDIAAGVEAAGQSALEELAFRRWGLALSLVAIILVVVALALKVRQIERRQGL